MNDQFRPNTVNDYNEAGNGLIISALIMQNELYNKVEKDSSILLFKLGKTEEEILLEIVGKQLIPTNISRKNQVNI